MRDPQVFSQLLQYMTVPVSDMFRDPPYFLALRRHVVPVLPTLPVDQDLDRRLQSRRGGVLHGHHAA